MKKKANYGIKVAEAQTVNPCLSKCMSQKRLIYSNRTVSYPIILLELLTVLLEYINFFCDMYFDKQEFIALHKCSAIYYASPYAQCIQAPIMLSIMPS